MAVSYTTEFIIAIYTSSNGIDFTYASDFTRHGILGIIYECPNLIEIPILGATDLMWLIFISINLNALLSGSTV